MPLIKTLSQTLKQDKEKFKVPKSVQQAIPIRKIWPDGIFQVESKYSRTFRFTDINYSIASKADKTEMFLDYSELLNALDSGCTAKITLNNRKINKEEFEQSLLIPMKRDGLTSTGKSTMTCSFPRSPVPTTVSIRNAIDHQRPQEKRSMKP